MPNDLPTSLQNIAANLVGSTPTKFETERHIIHLQPRITAMKLAEYVLADPSRQETIAKNAKRAPKAITFPYSRVRGAVTSGLSDGKLNPAFFSTVADGIQVEAGDTEWQRDDKTRSADALRRFAKIIPTLNLTNAAQIHRPERGWKALVIGGVRVSVNPELVFSIAHRGVTKVGAVMLNTGQAEELSLSRTNGRFSIGNYVTALICRMAEERLAAYGMPLHTKCCAVDIFRGEIHTAPATYKTLIKHMEAACKMIALRWDGLPGAEEPIEEDAEIF